MSDKTCGGCKWFKPMASSKGAAGPCSAPVPQHYGEPIGYVFRDDSATWCPCYAEKEGGNVDA